MGQLWDPALSSLLRNSADSANRIDVERASRHTKALISALVSQARIHGLEQIKLSVESGNTQAVRLYESFGFESFGLESRALKIDGEYYAENHMLLRL